MHDDDFLASALWLGQSDFDLAALRDIFGPVLVLSVDGSDFKIKHLKNLWLSFFGEAFGNPEKMAINPARARDFQNGASELRHLQRAQKKGKKRRLTC